jgi:hypothetical protein
MSWLAVFTCSVPDVRGIEIPAFSGVERSAVGQWRSRTRRLRSGHADAAGRWRASMRSA